MVVLFLDIVAEYFEIPSGSEKAEQKIDKD